MIIKHSKILPAKARKKRENKNAYQRLNHFPFPFHPFRALRGQIFLNPLTLIKQKVACNIAGLLIYCGVD